LEAAVETAMVAVVETLAMEEKLVDSNMVAEISRIM
jgi:hypothetical protein